MTESIRMKAALIIYCLGRISATLIPMHEFARFRLQYRFICLLCRTYYCLFGLTVVGQLD